MTEARGGMNIAGSNVFAPHRGADAKMKWIKSLIHHVFLVAVFFLGFFDNRACCSF
jgi:hypothetical protein